MTSLVVILILFFFLLSGKKYFASHYCRLQVILTQLGGARAKRFKCYSFSRTVTLIKANDEHTSFSEMRYPKTRSVIEFSSSATQDYVREKIQDTFPYLENKK